MYVNAAVDETDLSGVQEGQKVNCEFDAYPGRVFNGVVSRIDPQSTITNNVTQFDVRVEIDNKSPDFKLLRPGMNSTCTFISANKENVLSVESDAINTDDQGQSYVTIATGGKVAPEDPTTNMPVDPTVFVGIKTERRTVQTGLVGDDNTEITGGLQAGEKIVVSTVASSSQTDAASSQSGSSPFGGRPTPPKERKK
jgi:HlyD family secretion protein